MRTTITLDDDLEPLLKQAMLRDGKSFKRIVNEALRAALTEDRPQPAPFRQRTFDLGGSGLDLTKALSLAAELEDRERIRKLQAGR
jgi:hypothetical protein